MFGVFGLHALRVYQSKKREKQKEKQRSGRWTAVRDHFLTTHTMCAACGSKKNLQVHHIEPYHLHPELELDMSNLIALCMDVEECHLRVGHGGNFEAFNPHIVRDAVNYRSATPEDRAVIRKQIRDWRKI